MNTERIEKIFADFCRENGISPKLSYQMPKGYEDANGTYDVTVNTLFLNVSFVQTVPEEETLFYLFHELRHAMQYLKPELFDLQIQRSRFYVILYNGQCYKLVGDTWKECILQGSEEVFTQAYLSLPYEMDANRFAYDMAEKCCDATSELQALYRFYCPTKKMEYSELEKIFDQIDGAIS